MWLLLLSTGCLMLGATLGIFFHCMVIVAKESESKEENENIIDNKDKKYI